MHIPPAAVVRTGLAAINRELIARVEAMESSRRVVVDLDTTEIPVHGWDRSP